MAHFLQESHTYPNKSTSPNRVTPRGAIHFSKHNQITTTIFQEIAKQIHTSSMCYRKEASICSSGTTKVQWWGISIPVSAVTIEMIGEGTQVHKERDLGVKADLLTAWQYADNEQTWNHSRTQRWAVISSDTGVTVAEAETRPSLYYSVSRETAVSFCREMKQLQVSVREL